LPPLQFKSPPFCQKALFRAPSRCLSDLFSIPPGNPSFPALINPWEFPLHYLRGTPELAPLHEKNIITDNKSQ